MSDLELIARGRTAEVYAWEPGYVVKLFHTWVTRPMVLYEQRLAQTVHAAGVFTPAVGEAVIEREGRLGLVYQRVGGPTLVDELLRRPWKVSRLARQFGELQAAMHAAPAPSLPGMHDRLAEKINAASDLPADLRLAALRALEALPQDSKVCHGDFHPGNILLTSQGPMVIDWIDATAGHPLGDVARTTVLVMHGSLPPNPFLRLVVTLLRRGFYRAYTRRYFELSAHRFEQLHPWIGVVAAARLSEGIREETANLINLARRYLQKPD